MRSRFPVGWTGDRCCLCHLWDGRSLREVNYDVTFSGGWWCVALKHIHYQNFKNWAVSLCRLQACVPIRQYFGLTFVSMVHCTAKSSDARKPRSIEYIVLRNFVLSRPHYKHSRRTNFCSGSRVNNPVGKSWLDFRSAGGTKARLMKSRVSHW